jgi:hypothetical protein
MDHCIVSFKRRKTNLAAATPTKSYHMNLLHTMGCSFGFKISETTNETIHGEKNLILNFFASITGQFCKRIAFSIDQIFQSYTCRKTSQLYLGNKP